MKLKINIINFSIVILINLMPTLSAATLPMAASPEAATTSIADNPALEKVRGLTSSSMGILVMSTLGTIYSGILYKGAAEQEKEAKANIEKIDKLIKTFKDSYINFCPNGRESLNEPKCYCYLESGKQNPDRTNSQTCKDIWAKDAYMLSAKASDYGGVPHPVDPVGCVNLNGQFDEKCACTKFVDAKGSNTCMKTTKINIPSDLGSGFVTSSGLQQVTALSNNAANGNPKLDTMSASQLNASAINAKKLGQDIYTKLAPSLPKNLANLLKLDDKNIGRLAASVLGEKGMQAAMSGPSSAIGLVTSREIDGKMSSLLKDAARNAGILEVTGKGQGLANKKMEKETMNLNLMGENNNSGASQLQNFPEAEKNYNYKNSDISKQTDTSIFEIISNRYIQSGLKRLFDN